jgi:nucleotide-binding universal stress UspA family protein
VKRSPVVNYFGDAFSGVLSGGALVVFPIVMSSGSLVFTAGSMVAFWLALLAVTVKIRLEQTAGKAGDVYETAKIIGGLKTIFITGWMHLLLFSLWTLFYFTGILWLMEHLLLTLNGVFPSGLLSGFSGLLVILALNAHHFLRENHVTQLKWVAVVLCAGSGWIWLVSTNGYLNETIDSGHPLFAARLAESILFILILFLVDVFNRRLEQKDDAGFVSRRIDALALAASAILFGAAGFVAFTRNQGGEIVELPVGQGVTEAILDVQIVRVLCMVSGIIWMLLDVVRTGRMGDLLVRRMAEDRTITAWFLEKSSGILAYRPALAVTVPVVPALLVVSQIKMAASMLAIAATLFSAITAYLSFKLIRVSLSGKTESRTPGRTAIEMLAMLIFTFLVGLGLFYYTLSGILIAGWMGAGFLLFVFQWAERASVVQAGARGLANAKSNPGHSKSVFLLPVANPDSVFAIISALNELSAGQSVRVILLAIAKAPKKWEGVSYEDAVITAREALSRAITAAFSKGIEAEGLLSVAPDPWLEIETIAEEYRCDAILLGMGGTIDETFDKHVVRLANKVTCNVIFMRLPMNWILPDYAEVLVPTAGRSDHSLLRARLFSGLTRKGTRRVNFFTVVSPDIIPERELNLFKELHSIMLDEYPQGGKVELIKDRDIPGAIAARAENASLLVLGMPRSFDGKRIIGPLIQKVIESTTLPLLLITSGRDARSKTT